MIGSSLRLCWSRMHGSSAQKEEYFVLLRIKDIMQYYFKYWYCEINWFVIWYFLLLIAIAHWANYECRLSFFFVPCTAVSRAKSIKLLTELCSRRSRRIRRSPVVDDEESRATCAGRAACAVAPLFCLLLCVEEHRRTRLNTRVSDLIMRASKE